MGREYYPYSKLARRDGVLLYISVLSAYFTIDKKQHNEYKS